MKTTQNILIAGIGGQGILLLSKILTQGLAGAGFDVKMSESHGLAQRGGSVSAHLRFGRKIYAPVIGKGQGDILIGFEKMEALRWAEYLRAEGKIILNNCEIPSISVAVGNACYPKNIVEVLKAQFETRVIEAEQIAIKEIGDIRVQNTLLLGALVKAMELEEIDWRGILRRNLPEKVIEKNIEAFRRGMEA